MSSRVGVRLLGFVSTLILVRLLDPGDFGLAALVSSVVGIVALLNEFGAHTALIQNQQRSREYYDSAWSLNIATNLSCCVLVLVSAPAVALWMEQPVLATLLPVASLSFAIGALSNPGVVQFSQDLDFRTLFRLQMSVKCFSVVITLLLAWLLHSYWALVIGSVCNTVLNTAASYIIHPYRPRFCLSKVRELLGFSSWLFVLSLVRITQSRFINVLLGKTLGVQALGLYHVSNDVSGIVTAEVSAAINKASLPGYSKIMRDKTGNAVDTYFDVMSMTALVTIPAGLGLAAVADLAVPVLLGDKWLEAGPLMSVLSLTWVFMALRGNIGYMYIAMAKLRYAVTVALGNTAVLIVLVSLGAWRYGLLGAAYGTLLASAAMLGISLLCVRWQLGLALDRFFLCIARPAVAGLAMTSGLLWLLHEWRLSGAGALLLVIITGGVLYAGSYVGSYWIWPAKGQLESKIRARMAIWRLLPLQK